MLQLKLIPIADPTREHFFPGSLIVRAVSPGVYTFDDMADDISNSCSLTRADVVGCMEALLMYVRAALTDGYIVELRGLGRLRVTVQSDLVTPEEAAQPGFRPASLVRRHNVTFRPAAALAAYVEQHA